MSATGPVRALVEAAITIINRLPIPDDPDTSTLWSAVNAMTDDMATRADAALQPRTYEQIFDILLTQGINNKRIAQLEGELEVQKVAFAAHHELGEREKARTDKVAAQRDALVEALEFYADPHTYFAVAFTFDPPCGDFRDDFGETDELGVKPGKCARTALAAAQDTRECSNCGGTGRWNPTQHKEKDCDWCHATGRVPIALDTQEDG